MKWSYNKARKERFNNRIKRTWGKLDETDIRAIDGNRDRLVEMLQARYGYSRADSEGKVERMLDDENIAHPEIKTAQA